MTTPVVLKPPPAPRPKARTMGQSIVGHGALIGGSVIPWAGATFGVGGLLAGAGVTAAGVVGAAGVRKAARRARGRRSSGPLSRGGAGARGGIGGVRGLAGRSRAGGGLLGSRSGGGIGGRSGAAKRGGLGSKSRGFLGKLAGGRSGSPKRGGGIPGAGTTPTGKRNPLSKGRTAGSRTPGLGKRSAGGPTGAKTGSKRGSGLKLPGSSRGGRSVPGGRTRAGSKAGIGGGGRKGLSLGNGKRPSTGSGPSGSGRSKGLGLTRVGKNGKGILGDSRLGKAIRSKPLSMASLKERARKAIEARTAEKKNTTKPSGWAEIPLKTPNSKFQRKEQDMTGAHRAADSNGTGGAAARPWRRSSGGGRAAGGVTAAAEQFATSMAKPGTDIGPIRKLDGYLGDMAGGIGVAAKGLKDAAAQVTEAQPDNPQLAEQIGAAARLIQQASQTIEQAQALNKRKLAGDFERIEAPRKNEKERFDFGSNQD